MVAYESLRKLSSKIFKKESLIVQFDLEAKFLELLNAQNIFWLGIYFSPFLGLFAPVYYFFKFYVNKVSILIASNQCKI